MTLKRKCILRFARTEPVPTQTEVFTKGPIGGLFLTTIVRFWSRITGKRCGRCPSYLCTLQCASREAPAYCVVTKITDRPLSVEEARESRIEGEDLPASAG
jgi:hypothetical protein